MCIRDRLYIDGRNRIRQVIVIGKSVYWIIAIAFSAHPLAKGVSIACFTTRSLHWVPSGFPNGVPEAKCSLPSLIVDNPLRKYLAMLVRYIVNALSLIHI